MENKSNFYHWPTTVWLSSPSLCSREDEARPHTEAELQHFEKKKNFNGKSQVDFQIGGGRPCSSLLTQLLQGLNFESKAQDTIISLHFHSFETVEQEMSNHLHTVLESIA